ncbi:MULTISPECIES: N-acyl homoserine lactonase family protein [Asticcacaulis]|uniref:N-acyl homoserine lactonase family protein n=1 Tax=Asticcacaulis TaxID=76890 RepID=UPI001AE2D4BA|nr:MULTISPECIES: N-acyl homoserine lactonase family protein [Asticcacaulis]MBP2158134.1 glyoxylase-like metal-dependent hydrolase (beta-lactamase superfamily II) [Asticcacaulis solisilvae]MDR6799179.1 glyoxylase-like metal-dependent hydrolase (beta-lactamase superfamily II) [Asticcacaulis sp. BE141]
MKRIATALLALTAAFAAPVHAAPNQTPDVELWRLDCGQITVRDLSVFSDTFAYAGLTRILTDSCYLIRHGQDYMLWDSGLPAGLLGAKVDPSAMFGPTLKVDLPTQLAQIGVKPDQIRYLGLSHNHFDHTGQAATFAKATLLIGAADLAALKHEPLPFAVDPAPLRPWLDGKAKTDPVTGDRDVFGDGSVVMLAAPGHTPGETALLVRLPRTGAVLLSGDVVHFAEQWEKHGVPTFNADRADTLASMARLQAVAAELKATLIIQHEPADIAKLPAFPKSAR